MLPILMHGKTCSEVFWVAFGWKFDQTRACALLSNKKKKKPYKCTEIQYVQKQIRGTKQQINWGVCECWSAQSKNKNVKKVNHGNPHSVRWDDNSWQKSAFSTTKITKSFVWSVGSEELLFITYFKLHPCCSNWHHKGERRDTSTETEGGR